MAARNCRTCGHRLATRQGECDACAAYRRKHGNPRPERLIVRAAQREILRELEALAWREVG